jgi:hypothetical protein
MDLRHPGLRERYTFMDFLYYMTLGAVPLFSACYAIARYSSGWLIVYLVLCVSSGAVIYRFYCSHCPHYTRAGRSTRCMFFWGMPKFFKPHPGPLGLRDKTMTVLPLAVLIIFPLNWLLKTPGLLVIAILSLITFLATVRRNECRRCIYYDCPVNKVPEELQPHEDTA